MEQSSQIEVLEAQIRECYGRVAWSHKTQEKCADIALNTNSRIKFCQIVLSAMSTASIVSIIFVERIGIILGTIFSTILLVLNTYTKDYDLGEIAQKHTNAANELWNIRESYLSLLTDIRTNSLATNQIMDKRDDLQCKLSNIYSGSPRTNIRAYKEATKALKLNEELTFSDKEIDMLLPKKLRKIVDHNE